VRVKVEPWPTWLWTSTVPVGIPFVEDARMTCRDVNVYYGEKHAINNISIDESVDLLGFWFEIKACEKNNHRHIVDIPRIIFFV
jgi:hypothetical protein